MLEEFSLLPLDQQAEILDALDPQIVEQMALGYWWWTARPEQIPPEGSWDRHIYLAGRGSGKTRSGAEWLIERTLAHPHDVSGFPTERLVMAYSLSEARMVCIEGPSGILRVLHRMGFKETGPHYSGPKELRFHYTRSPKPHITFLETEAKIFFTGADPDAARGFNLADVWMDEIVKYIDAHLCWKEGVRPALRADIPGDKPRAFITTTPKPIPLLQDWVQEAKTGSPTISMVRGSTFDNKLNLSEDFLRDIAKMYEGTALGRQELYGEMLDGFEGALFPFSSVHNHRVTIGPAHVAHRTVGVDPGLTGNEDGDETGVIVVCRDERDHMFVVADETVRLSGRDAALHAWRVFERYGCDTLVYESNLGKAWMQQVFTDAFRELQRSGVFPIEVTNPPLVPVFSTQGKKLRAEPVAMRYNQGRVHHIGTFETLENQMFSFDPVTSKTSPDRLDALVHACRHLIDGERRKTRLISPLNYKFESAFGPAF